MADIIPVPAFSDNYIWLFHAGGRAAVVDPGDAAPVKQALAEYGLALDTVLITHHHFDHVGGLAQLIASHQPRVIGPDNPGIDGISEVVGEGDRVQVLGLDFEVIEVPGHTLDHIAFVHSGDDPLVFCGDTLFAGGCGRVFEGDPPMMLRSLERLAALPADTRVYCAHEYTLANLAFAEVAEPANDALAARHRDARATRERGEPTVPSTIGLELATNPFLRSDTRALRESLAQQGRLAGDSPVEVFATVRGWKDNF